MPIMDNSKEVAKGEEVFDTQSFYKVIDPRSFARNIGMETTIVQLLIKEPFFSNMIRQCQRIYTWEIETAAVSYDKKSGRFALMINPLFFADCTLEERVAVLIHEMCHLIYKHVTARLPAEVKTAFENYRKLDESKESYSKEETQEALDKYQEAKSIMRLWNIATDLAINSHIPGLPKNKKMRSIGGQVMKPCIPGEGDFEAFNPGQLSETYFQQLKKYQEQLGGGGVRYVIDDHDWGQGEDGEGEGIGQRSIQDAEVRRILSKATSEANKSNQWGNVPQEMKKYIDQLLNPQLDWRAVLRMFIRRSVRGERYGTFKRVNRKYPYQHPGRSKRRVSSVAIAIDQSGSVSDKELAVFFAELASLASQATFHVIPFDSNVNPNHIFQWRKNERKLPERVACGGTNFQAPTDYINKHSGKYDGLIIFTDMYAPEPGPCNIQRMWITATDPNDWPFTPKQEWAVQIDLDRE